MITQSTSQAIVAGNSASCNSGGLHADNSYWRAFNMATFTGSQQYNVTSVSFGIETANAAGTGTTQPVTVRLYTTSNFPVGFPGSLTQIGPTTMVNVADQTLTVLSVPLVATVPAGTTQLVMEVFTPSGQVAGHSFFIGSNTAAQTGPSYISAAACGFTTPTDVSTIGFPNMHIVFNVNGSCGGGNPDPKPNRNPDGNTHGYPNPDSNPGYPNPDPNTGYTDTNPGYTDANPGYPDPNPGYPNSDPNTYCNTNPNSESGSAAG